MAIIVTEEQWRDLVRRLDRILAEQMLRQPLDANVAKRLSDLEQRMAVIEAGKPHA